MTQETPTNRSKKSPFEAAALVRRELEGAGFEAWLVGGAVRDVRLGVAPLDLREVDVATAATPEEVRGVFRRTLEIGKAFGVVQVQIFGQRIEVATFRKDLAYKDGRRPESVVFTTAEEDVQRRDFTINGLLWNPDTNEIRDYVDGLRDLERRRIRAIGDPALRFAEDHLRMLRAVRFAATRDFHLDEPTEAAIGAAAPKLKAIAPERCRDELLKIAEREESRPGDAYAMLVRTGLARAMLPESWVSPPEAALTDDARILNALHPMPLCVLLAVAMRGSAPLFEPLKVYEQQAEAVAMALRLSTEEASELARLLRGRSRYRGLLRQRLSRQRLLATRIDRDWHERLLAAEGDADLVLRALADIRLALPTRPEPLLDGRALLRAGCPPGPMVGRALRKLRVLQLEGRLQSATEGLQALGLAPPL